MTPVPRLRARGKVRDVYDAGGDRLLLVATDRISAFDVVLPDPVPDKGRVLTGLSSYWFARTADLVPNHLLSTDAATFPSPFTGEPALAGRAMLARRAEVVPIECVARGYLSGSGWAQYRATSSVCGVLPERSRGVGPPARTDLHPDDQGGRGARPPLDPDEAVALVGKGLFERLKELSLSHLRADRGHRGRERRDRRGHEAGVRAAGGELVPIDEVGTPTPPVSGRPTPTHRAARSRRSTSSSSATGSTDRLDREPPPPALPPDVVEGTAERYREAYEHHRGGVRWVPRPRRSAPARRQASDDAALEPAPGRPRVRFTVEVLVTLKPGLADPQGKAVEGALPSLGWTNVHGVRGEARPLRGRIGRRDVRARPGSGDGLRLLSTRAIEDSRVLGVREVGRS